MSRSLLTAVTFAVLLSFSAHADTTSTDKVATATSPETSSSPSVTADATGEKYGKTTGILGDTPLVFGPKITGFGTPTPFRVGLEGKWNNQFGLSFDYGFIPTLTFSSVSVKLTGWQVAARYYPWERAFYVGLGFGGQTFTGSKTEIVAATPQTVTIAASSTLMTPQIGWRWTWTSGFFLGLEAGVQIPISSTITVTSSAGATPAQITDVNNKAKTFADSPFPQFALVQFGYFL